MAGYRRRRGFHIGSCFAGGAITALLLIALGFDRRLPARMLAAEERAEKALGLHLHNPMAMRDRSADAREQQQKSKLGDVTPASADGGAVEPVDLQQQSSEQLADLMMWWRHSRPVKRAIAVGKTPACSLGPSSRKRRSLTCKSSLLPPGPAGPPLYPPPNQTSYLTWEPDFAGLNNVRLQVTS